MKRASDLRFRYGYLIHQVFVVSLTTLSAIIILTPVVWMINAAMRPIKENELYRGYFVNSTIISLSTLAIVLVLGLLAAYGFSRFKMVGGRYMLLGIMALLMLPTVTLIVPYFRLAHLVGLYDTLFGLIVVNSAFILPICIWLLKGYMDAIPVDLEEAAMIDGCTRLQAMQKILVPLAVPGIVGTGTFVFVFAWNEFLLAVTLTDSPGSQPLTIGLAAFFGQFVRDWNSIMALSTITSIPLMIIFVLFQRWVVQGMTSGAVK